ncbi:MAG TPA: lipoprotein signal peptidase [Saprospiraceae bacterium]|nr:lipoprotein signal peptidase [Saprospiraceae bacterium]
MKISNRSGIVISIVFLVLLIDQGIKIWVKTHMEYGEEFGILGLSWARIHFVENEGMAFGLSLGGNLGKLALSVFRLVAVGFLIYIIHNLVKAKETFGVILSFSLILAGALGNILDSAVYGLIFSNTPYHGGLATLFPEEGGYASFLFGKVVDMLYFPIIDTTFPDSFPIWGGERFQFFRPVFNISDAAISTGVISLLLFHRRIFKSKPATETTEENKMLENDIAAGSSVEDVK